MKQVCIFIFLFFFLPTDLLAEGKKYTCPMHPHYIASEPGTCPICGMDLVPIADQDGNQQLSSDEREKILISPQLIQNIGVRTEKVQKSKFGGTIRSFGLITENERLQKIVSSRVAGWVEDLKITAVGDSVKSGELIFTLYSPELVSAQQDLLSALSSGVSGRIQSTSTRLISLGVQKKFVNQIKSSRKSFQNVPIYAEGNGIVSEINIKIGSYIKPGIRIATIQDYSTVWINVSVAEKDLRYLSVGGKASVFFPNLGNISKEAKIDYIHPTIDMSTRTGKVRLVLENKDGSLKPGAYADIEFDTDIQERLSVPSEAVLKSDEGDFVIKSLGQGYFQPIKVKTGIHNKGYTEILSGLNENDEIVVSSQFLIDSESALREAFRKIQKQQTPLSLLKLDKNQLAIIDHYVDAAIYLHEVLSDKATFNAKFLDPALQLNKHLLPVFRNTKLEPILEDAEAAIKLAQKSLTKKETSQALGKLLQALYPWLIEGKPEHYKKKGVFLFIDHETNQYWVQLDKTPVNPYGSSHAVQIEWPNNPNEKAPKVDKQTIPGAGHGHH